MARRRVWLARRRRVHSWLSWRRIHAWLPWRRRVHARLSVPHLELRLGRRWWVRVIMMFFDDNFLNNNFLMDTFVEGAFTLASPLTLSCVDAISDYANAAAAKTQEYDSSATTAALLSRVHRVLVVAIRAIIEVVSIPIVVDQHEGG